MAAKAFFIDCVTAAATKNKILAKDLADIIFEVQLTFDIFYQQALGGSAT